MEKWINLYTGLKLKYIGESIEKKGLLENKKECYTMVIHSNPQNVCRLWTNGGKIRQNNFCDVRKTLEKIEKTC